MPLMRRLLALALAIGVAAASGTALAQAAKSTVLRVGPQQQLKKPSAAARIARDGDIVEIDAGTYAGDAAVWRQHGLTIRAVGGPVHLRADGAHAEGKAIWVLKGSNTTVEGIEFSGAKVRDRNGAGIRLQGAGLTVRKSYFHHNENGILTGTNADSDIVVEHSEFAHNGFGNGQSHNLYIGRVRSFTLRYSYVHHAMVGHNVKSRAQKNFITYNRIADETDGRSSYAIDLPNGGLSFVIGNVIQQGPANENRTIVSYGAERLTNPLNELYFINNTVVNDDPAGGRFIVVKEGVEVARVLNNLFSGRGELTGPGDWLANERVPKSAFVQTDDFDYRLKQSAAGIGRGVEPGSAHDFALRPTAEYVHKAGKRERKKQRPLDLGALAYDGRR